MWKNVTSYRVTVPAEKDPDGRQPQLILSATSAEEAKRQAWDLMTWPQSIRDASELEAVEVYITKSSIERRRDGT